MDQKQEPRGDLLLGLPNDLLLYLASFLEKQQPLNLLEEKRVPNPHAALFALGLVSKRLRSIMFTSFWNDLVRNGSRYKILEFLRRRYSLPPSLSIVYFPNLYGEMDAQTKGRTGVDRLITLRYGHSSLQDHHYTAKLPKTDDHQRVMYGTATRLDFKTTTAYHAYLLAHPLDEYLDSDDHWLKTDEQGQTLGQVFTARLTVFHALTLMFAQTYPSLEWAVLGNTKLPLPFRVRQNFETTAAYFEYLVNHIHDLYISLRTSPDLINVQDEHGKTLLFHLIHAAKYLEKDRIEWLLQILLGTPGINMSLADNDGNTFVHEATIHCADAARNAFGLQKKEDSIFFDFVFVPLVKYAQNNGFDFSILNKERFAVIHIAGQIPSIQQKWITNIKAMIAAPLEFNPIAVLIAGNHVDLNQLSGENCTALYYAITRAHLTHIHTLLYRCQFETAPQRKVIPLLEHKINHLSRKLIVKLQAPPTTVADDVGSDRAKIKTYFGLLTGILTKVTGKNYDQEQERHRKWPTKAFIRKVVERFQKSTIDEGHGTKNDVKKYTNRLLQTFQSALREDSDAEYSDLAIWNFLANKKNVTSRLFKIIVQALQEELELLIVDVTRMTEPFTLNPKPLTDYFKIRQGDNSSSSNPEQEEPTETSHP